MKPLGAAVLLGLTLACCHREPLPVPVPCPEPPILARAPLPIDILPLDPTPDQKDRALRASIVILKAEVTRRDMILDAYRKRKP